MGLDRLADTLDEYGVAELDGDRDTLGEVVAPPADWTHGDTTCAYVAGMVAGWTDDTPDARHPWLVSQSVRLACAHRLGCITSDDHQTATSLVADRFRWLVDHTVDRRGTQPGEITDALSWGIAKAATFTDQRARRELGGHQHQAVEVTSFDLVPTPSDEVPGTDLMPRVPTLPPEFWQRPILAHIRQAAHARQRSADAVFHTVLTRVCATVDHRLRVPPIVGSAKPLSYFVAIVATSGGGKSSANDIAVELLPAPDWVLDQIPPGSGEGLAELLFDMVDEPAENGKTIKVKKQVRNAAIVYIDEGQVLSELGNRRGATLLPTLRTIFTGGPLGQANANRERFRVVPGHSYVFGVSVGFQMTTAADLLGDVAAGTPQRFGWVAAEDPTIERCDWPGPLPWTPPPHITTGQSLTYDPAIEDQVRTDDLARSRAQVKPHPLDSHSVLYRLKVAALLALLDGRRHVQLDDWALALMVRETSDAVRTMVGNAVAVDAARKEQIAQQRHAGRHVAAGVAVRQEQVDRAAGRIAAKVRAQPGEYSPSSLRRDNRAAWWRDTFAEGLERAIADGQVEVREAPGQGGPQQRLWPAKRGGG